MARYKLLVLTNPVEGADAEYNDWYTNQHLQDVTAVPGFVSAQRFKLVNDAGYEHEYKYIALYDVETDAPQATLEELFSRQGTEAMFISEALDLDGAKAGLFAPCSDFVTNAVAAST